MDILSKSKKDADEERKEGLQAETIKRSRALEWYEEEGETMDYLEGDEGEHMQPTAQILEAMSVEKYLIYDNPIVTSFTNHTFVSSALFGAKSLAILLNSRTCSAYFSHMSCTTHTAEEPRQQLFYAPYLISEKQASHWKEVIGEEVVKQRQYRSMQLPIVSSIASGNNSLTSSFSVPIDSASGQLSNPLQHI